MQDAVSLARQPLKVYPIGNFCHDSCNLQSEHGAASRSEVGIGINADSRFTCSVEFNPLSAEARILIDSIDGVRYSIGRDPHCTVQSSSTAHLVICRKCRWVFANIQIELGRAKMTCFAHEEDDDDDDDEDEDDLARDEDERREV